MREEEDDDVAAVAALEVGGNNWVVRIMAEDAIRNCLRGRVV